MEIKAIWKSFVRTYQETILEVFLFMQNTFNPLHGYHPKKNDMGEQIIDKLNEFKKNGK